MLFETRDLGRTWSQISPDLTRNDPSKQQVAGGPINTDVSGAEFYDTIFDIAPSRRDAGRIWVGTDDGLVQLTTDARRLQAGTGNVTPPDVAPWGRIDTVEASSFDARRAYVAIDRHVMGDPRPYVLVTDDSGATWRTIVNGLPGDQYVHVVREDPANPDVLYAGLEQGVWFSLDRGAHWQSLRLNMPSVAVHDLRVQPRQHDLIVATHGRGFWILDDAGAISGLRKARRGRGSGDLPAAHRVHVVSLVDERVRNASRRVLRGGGSLQRRGPRRKARSITYYLPSQARAWIDVLDSNGRRVRCLDAAGRRRRCSALRGTSPRRRRCRGCAPATGTAAARDRRSCPGRYTVALARWQRDRRTGARGSARIRAPPGHRRSTSRAMSS